MPVLEDQMLTAESNQLNVQRKRQRSSAKPVSRLILVLLWTRTVDIPGTPLKFVIPYLRSRVSNGISIRTQIFHHANDEVVGLLDETVLHDELRMPAGNSRIIKEWRWT
jgi:hypothetical protein